MNHPYLSRKHRHQPQYPHTGEGAAPKEQMVMKAKNRHTKGLGEVKNG